MQYPAKEVVNLVNKSNKTIKSDCIFGTEKEGVAKPGEPFIYKGPDREALKMLNESGGEFLGMDFKRDPEFRQASRTQGFESIDEFLEYLGYDEKQADKEFEKKASIVSSGEIPKRVKEIKAMGGGRDTSGNSKNDVIGGFGDQQVRPAKEVK